MFYFSIIIIMLAIFRLGVLINGGKPLETAHQTLLGAIIIAAYTTGIGIPLANAGLSWADVFHGKITDDLASDMIFAGVVYGGLVAFVGLFVSGPAEKIIRDLWHPERGTK